jgi:hypothetical protein
MHKFKLTILAILAFFLSRSTINGQTASEQTVRNKFTEYITPRLDGRELKLTIFSGDINGDGQPDFIISYCIQATDKDRDAGGGNALMNLVCMQDGIAAYIKSGNDYILKAEKSMDNFKIYTDNEIFFEVKGIENGKILCQSTAYGPADPRCCPTVTKKVYVKYENGKLIKQTD